jgi:Down-regulated in metastasis
LQVGEADYDARLAAYARLTPALWGALPPWQAAPLVHASLADLRNADDIALRSAAAQVARGHNKHLGSLA